MKPIVAMAIKKIAGRWQVDVCRGSSRHMGDKVTMCHFDTFDAALTYADSLRGQGQGWDDEDDAEAVPS